jgi:tetratricopeptide (TPR) repeat protein
MKSGLAVRRVVRCIVLSSMLSLFCSAAIASDAQSYQTAAAAAVAKLDYEQALEIYSKGLEQQFSAKDQADLLLMRGITAHLANKSGQAEVDFNAVVKMIGNTDPRAYRERGFFHYSEGRLERALADYTPGARSFPDNGMFPNRQGMVLCDLGRFDEAISRAEEAIKLDPASGLFMLGRAEAYNRSDRAERALADYERALALGHLTRSDTYRLRVGVGAAHLKLRNYQVSIESLDAAVDLRPDSTTALRYRGVAFEAMGNVDRASRDYEAVLRLKPGDEFAVKQLDKLRKK